MSTPSIDPTPTTTSTKTKSSRERWAADDVRFTEFAALPRTTPSEERYAQAGQELIESIRYWRSKAEEERRKAETAQSQAENAINKLMQTMKTESETLLTQLRAGQAIPTPAGTTNSASPIHSSMHVHQAHPSHLSRRVSFNRDVVMVVSPEIGHGDGAEPVPRVDEDDELADGSCSSSSSVAAKSNSDVPAQRPTNQRRLSRTDINEGAILKQHLDLSDLEKEEINNKK